MPLEKNSGRVRGGNRPVFTTCMVLLKREVFVSIDPVVWNGLRR